MNNGSTIEAKETGLKVAVNSIQRTLHVERLYVNIAYPADRIIPYDRDNLYPNKVKAIAQRSGTTMSSIGTLSAFLSGEGFAQMTTIVNSENQTLWDILRHISDSRAMFKGFALHFNYNMLGQITEINPINFEFVRWSKNLNSFIVNPDWFRRNRRKEEIEYSPFNPANVLEEIKECRGIDNYNGQLLYWIPNLADYYTVCNWDSVLDDAQFEAEAKLYGLSSIQNDYSLSGLITYPKNISDSKEIQDIKEDLQNDQGSANAGGVRVIGAMPNEGMTNWKWFTPMSRNNIDALHKNQKEDAKFNIYAAFRQPPILNGVATSGMFNQESFADAFHYYNSATQTERIEIERELNKIISISIWANIGTIKIEPKKFEMRGEALQSTATPIQSSVNDTLTNLTGRQLQGVFRITRKFKKGELTQDQAATLLKDGFGFSDEQINIWLVNDDE
jgi:hypothetical protein